MKGALRPGLQLVVVEEHSVIGGLASALTDAGYDVEMRIGIPDEFPSRYGSRDDQLAYYGLTCEAIVERVRREFL